MSDGHKPTRRGLLLGGSAAALGAAAGMGGFAVGRDRQPDTETQPQKLPATRVDFHGRHQAGIADATPTHAAFLAFDLSSVTTKGNLAAIMRAWTDLGRRLAVGDASSDPSLISLGSEPALFTMTVGIGGAALDQLGIARPAPLVDLPEFRGDRLDPDSSDGGIFLQLCSNDAIYLSGAVRAARGIASPLLDARWQMNGFRGVNAATSSTSGRNLMGQIDGTNNIAVSRASAGGAVWVDQSGPKWMAGGSYVALRRFRMLLQKWEDVSQTTRDRAIGRCTRTGAPLGGHHENDPVDLDARHPDGSLVVPADAHIRLAAPRRDAGEAMLRRSYSYSSGQADSAPGDEDAGLVFVSYQSDPRTSFIPVQRRLAEADALNSFTVATAQAMFAILPGIEDDDDWYGRKLLG